MNEELNHWHEQIAATSGDEQIRLFVRFCTRLVELRDEEKLTEEEAAYYIVGNMQFDTLTNSPVCEAIFDVAGTVELPRETSYTQLLGSWDKKTADDLKEKEWQELLAVIKTAEGQMSQ